MKNDKESRNKRLIKKHSPSFLQEYQAWIEQGKPIKYAVYLLHDSSPGLKIKKIGSSKTLWRRVFGGLNYRYFYNFSLIDKKYFKTEKLMRDYEKIIQDYYKNVRRANVDVFTFAYNARSDLKKFHLPKNKIEGRLANGGSENFKENLVPGSFNEIEKELKTGPEYKKLINKILS